MTAKPKWNRTEVNALKRVQAGTGGRDRLHPPVLPSSLLYRAFSGKLIAQKPNGETVSELLERTEQKLQSNRDYENIRCLH
jgi:hypothetical protein